jgi:Spirocyclase AveC-like
MSTHTATQNRWLPSLVTRRRVILALGAAAILAFLALTLRTGPEGRIEAKGIPNDPHEFLGISNWVVPIQVICFSAWALFLAYVIRVNRQSDRLHPMVAVFIGLSVCALQDPIQNWAVFAAYDPRLLHFPVDWPYFNTSPTVEPLLPLLLYPIAFGIPALIALGIYRRLVQRAAQAGRSTSFLIRRPLLSVFLVAQAIAIPVCFVNEFVATRMHIFTFTQLAPAVASFDGSQGQFPIFWDGPFLGALIAISAVFMLRDDAGRTVLDRIVERSPRLRGSPRLAVVLLSVAILSTYYAAYGVPYWMLRLTDSSSSVASPWPLKDTKLYDPQGRLKKAGLPGPSYKGPLAGWPSGQ